MAGKAILSWWYRVYDLTACISPYHYWRPMKLCFQDITRYIRTLACV